MAVLVIAEHNNASVKGATLNTVTAAAELGDVTLLVAGASCRPAAEEAAKIAGVSKVIVVDDPALAQFLAEALAPVIVDLAAGYSHIFAPATSIGKNVMPRVAALMDVAMVSDITEIVDADTFVRPIYAGNAMATVKSNDAVKIATIRGTAFEAAAEDGGSAAIEDAGPAVENSLSRFIGQELSQSERPELTAAKTVISGGRGMASGENFKLIDEIADKLGPQTDR